MLYLHLLIGLISSKKYRSVAKNLGAVLNGAIQVKSYYENSYENLTRKKKD